MEKGRGPNLQHVNVFMIYPWLINGEDKNVISSTRSTISLGKKKNIHTNPDILIIQTHWWRFWWGKLLNVRLVFIDAPFWENWVEYSAYANY